ncbi:endonuclease III domain-containing protein [Bremerella sp. TYQ1]|uniref:endonuclease III domain-containing protein n=1 Tax=Bremerella sp. TYQ1 TaxID=3119568 RepID=UPI001CC9DAFC|nr:endonuclease III domain-containing protein [Bremerella volcania]UBM34256.1 endonuclease III domain-containing protein [Bremerella volcania]
MPAGLDSSSPDWNNCYDRISPTLSSSDALEKALSDSNVSLNTVFEKLLEHYGPQQWWPGDSPLEIMIGAVLTQNTSWKNVEKAIANLKDADLLHLGRLHATRQEELAEIIRPSGYYRLKAKRLWNLIDHVMTKYDGDLEWMFSHDVATLREELLGINGIGPETADSILLYAGNLKTFVVDAYTARILKRHGWIDWEADYHQIQDHFVSQVPDEVSHYNEFHALIVRTGNQFCRKTPKCEGCPLQSYLPASGIQEPI